MQQPDPQPKLALDGSEVLFVRYDEADAAFKRLESEGRRVVLMTVDTKRHGYVLTVVQEFKLNHKS